MRSYLPLLLLGISFSMETTSSALSEPQAKPQFYQTQPQWSLYGEARCQEAPFHVSKGAEPDPKVCSLNRFGVIAECWDEAGHPNTFSVGPDSVGSFCYYIHRCSVNRGDGPGPAVLHQCRSVLTPPSP
jgi:hypothetical protein